MKLNIAKNCLPKWDNRRITVDRHSTRVIGNQQDKTMRHTPEDTPFRHSILPKSFHPVGSAWNGDRTFNVFTQREYAEYLKRALTVKTTETES